MTPAHGEHRGNGHERLSHLPDSARPAVFAARAGVTFDPPAGADELEAVVARFLAAVRDGLAAAGCTLVGHIKGALATPGRGDLAFHLTALTSEPSLSGGGAGPAIAATLTLNVIVFGVDEQVLPGIVARAWATATPAATAWRS